MGQCAQQQSEEHRELAFTILYELTETVGDVLTTHFDVLQGLFLQALKDPRCVGRGEKWLSLVIFLLAFRCSEAAVRYLWLG